MNKSILIVDDDLDTLFLWRTLLETSSYKFLVHTVTTAKLALRYLRIQKFDLVVCDYMMPEMDGFELKKRLNIEKIDTCFIFISGFADNELKIAARHLGVVGCLKKPIGPTQLVNACVQAIEYCSTIQVKKEYLQPIAELDIEYVDTRIFKMLSGDYMVGRSENADIRINLTRVSREHFRLKRLFADDVHLKDEYLIVDFSSNGVDINGKKINHSQILDDNDVIVIPQCKMVYRKLEKPERDSDIKKTAV